MVSFYFAVLHKISRKLMEVGELLLIKAESLPLIKSSRRLYSHCEALSFHPPSILGDPLLTLPPTLGSS